VHQQTYERPLPASTHNPVTGEQAKATVSKTPFGFRADVAGEGTGTQSGFGMALLRGLGTRMDVNGRAQHIYGGTVPEAVKQRRRAANRVARRSRRANRRG